MCVNVLCDAIACGHRNCMFLFIQVSNLLCVSGDSHLGCFLIQQYKYQHLKTGKNPHEMMAPLSHLRQSSPCLTVLMSLSLQL